MSIFKVHKDNNYITISNYHFKEKNMSLKAKGLLSLMLSLPKNWDYSINGLVQLSKDNKHSVETALKELKEFGYLKIVKLMANETDTGRIEYIYNIYERPQNNDKVGLEGLHKVDTLDPENLGLEFLGLEFLELENQTQYIYNSKELYNNNIINNNSKELLINSNIIYSQVVDYLNEKTGKHYKSSTPKTKTLINARVKEGFTLEDFKKVIDTKCDEWLDDKKMCNYLRPETLFGTKFEGYLNQDKKNITTKDLSKKIDFMNILKE